MHLWSPNVSINAENVSRNELYCVRVFTINQEVLASFTDFVMHDNVEARLKRIRHIYLQRKHKQLLK